MFEDLLDNIPTTNIQLSQLGKDITQPPVVVKSNDCFTTVGKLINLTYGVEGFIELATDAAITKTRIETLLLQGIYTTTIRHLYNCVQPGGICQKCYTGTYLDQAAPVINSVVRIIPEYNYQTNIWIGDGATTTFQLSEDSSAYTKVLIFINGILQLSGFTTSGTTLTASVAPTLGQIVNIKFYKLTTRPYISYIAETYTGALLGMKQLTTSLINVRPSLLQSSLSDANLSMMRKELEKSYPTIPSLYLDYVDAIHDILERAIYLIVLYSLYDNVNT